VFVRQHVVGIAWASAAAIGVALAVFLVAADPLGGISSPDAQAWVSTAAALTWALCATFIKATTGTLASFGVFGMFLHWPVSALAVTGLALCSSRRRCIGPR
jgi:hypothetical protein